MALYKLDSTQKSLTPIPTSSFAGIDFLERQHLQPLLRDNLGVLDSELFLLSESFRAWEDSSREIDLVALDQEGNLVVIELKRTEDAGHAELQAIRYAAMLSAFDFDAVVSIYESFLVARGKDATSARAEIEAFLQAGEQTIAISNQPRILLVSAGFSREITTTVLWLNEVGLDIRCIQIQPYVLDGTPYLDVEQVIPLPSAQDYMFGLRRKSVSISTNAPVSRRERTLNVLLDAGELAPNDSLVMIRPPKQNLNVPQEMQHCVFEAATNKGILWTYDNQYYSLSGLTRKIYNLLGGTKNLAFTGGWYWAREGERMSLWDKAEKLQKSLETPDIEEEG